MEKIVKGLLASTHPEDVRNKFIIVILKGWKAPKEEWERLCEYAYELTKHTSRVYSASGELILAQIAHLQTSIYMLYFNSGWIEQSLSNTYSANSDPSYQQLQHLRVLSKIIKYKQEVASDSDDVKNDCLLLQSYANKYVMAVKDRIDLLKIFISMFIDIPQSIPENHVGLIELFVYSLAIPENDPLESYNEFVEQSVNMIEYLWQKNPDNIDITIRQVFIRLSSKQTCSKSIVVLISKIPNKYTSVILPYVQNIDSAVDVNKFELCVERMISMIPHKSADNISCWIIELVKALEKLKNKTTLIRVAHKNVTRCFQYLLDRHARHDALEVLICLLLGTPDSFNSIIADYPKVLGKIAQEKDQDTLLELSKIAQCLMQRNPSGYKSLSKYLKSLDLPELNQNEISNILRKTTWFQRKSFADVYSSQKNKEIIRKKGLQNLGNTCFMNSVLQALFNSIEFRNRILQTKVAKSKTSTIYHLQLCFARMMFSTKTHFSPSALLETLPTWLNNGRQQDCHEFLKVLFSQIEEELKKSKKSIPDLEKEVATHVDIPLCPFGGKLENIIECLTCENNSKTEEEFHDLSLSLKVGTSDSLSFSDLLSGFLSAEYLKGDNQYFCENCEGLRDAKKLTRIIIPPRYLIFSLNRFEYDVKCAKRIKITTHVSIQDSLSIVQTYENESFGLEKQYDLSAIVIHSGSSAEYGHYYTYAKDEEEGEWYSYNDRYVSTSSLSKIISDGEEFKSDTPYLLFFKQKNIVNQKLPLSEIPKFLIKEVEKDDKDFSMDDVSRKKDEEDPLSGYDIFDYDKSVF